MKTGLLSTPDKRNEYHIPGEHLAKGDRTLWNYYNNLSLIVTFYFNAH